MKVTNNSQALQGVNGKAGTVFIRPGETKEVEFDEVGLKQAKRLDFLSIGGAKAEKKQDDAGLKAVHRGGGSYSIMDGDKEVVEKLTKEDAEAFNVASDEDKAAFVAARTK